ncbi:MAG: AAA family ATPase [Bacteroidales bacterium]
MSEKEKATITAANPNNAGNKGNSFSEPAKTVERTFPSKTFPYFLTILKEHGGNLSFGEYSHYLQDALGEEWNAISPTITKLCDEGYIDADKKEFIYTLTVAGYDYINSTPTPPAEIKSPDGATADAHEDIAKAAPAPQPSEERGFTFEGFLADCKRLENTHQAGMLIYRTANQRMRDAAAMPIPRDLYPPLQGLIFEGDIIIMGADTGIGKSVFALQIASYIARYIAQTEPVLHLDFEISDKAFQKRYSTDYVDNYIFPENLQIICPARPVNIPQGKKYDNYIIESIRDAVVRTGGKVVIVDNMICLASTDTDTSAEAIPLMERLIAMRDELGLTMLLVEHTRKDKAYNYTRPLSRDDLQGSKMKVNRCDSAFGIGRSAKDTNLRYIKQFKCRSGEEIYTADNVAVFELVKENSCLQFKFVGFDTESNHLREVSDDDRKQLRQYATALHAEGKSLRDIAEMIAAKFGTRVTHTTISNWIKK